MPRQDRGKPQDALAGWSPQELAEVTGGNWVDGVMPDSDIRHVTYVLKEKGAGPRRGSLLVMTDAETWPKVRQRRSGQLDLGHEESVKDARRRGAVAAMGSYPSPGLRAPG